MNHHGYPDYSNPKTARPKPAIPPEVIRVPNDSHRRAAEFHDLAAHAHRAAAVHHAKEDHQTGHEHSKQAMEHAIKAFHLSEEAHRKSAKSISKV